MDLTKLTGEQIACLPVTDLKHVMEEIRSYRNACGMIELARKRERERKEYKKRCLRLQYES